MSQPDPARQRFIALQAIRLSGAVFALIGLVTIAGKMPLPVVAGYAFLGVGFLDLFVVPLLLAKRWKSPPQ